MWRLWPFQSKDKENVPIQPYSRMSSEFSINLFVLPLHCNILSSDLQNVELVKIICH
jgi:hypothetical protein